MRPRNYVSEYDALEVTTGDTVVIDAALRLSTSLRRD
jgi:hypothetical protein